VSFGGLFYFEESANRSQILRPIRLLLDVSLELRYPIGTSRVS